MENLDTKTKVGILTVALQERYKTLHIIRDRVQKMGLWFLGIMASGSGWLIQTQKSFTNPEKLLFIIVILIVVYILKCEYLDDLEKGFKSQQQTAVRIEKTLGLYKIKEFNQEDSSIYPHIWETAGTEAGTGNFFKTSYLLIYLGALLAILSILLSNSSSNLNDKQNPAMHIFYNGYK